MTVTVLILAFNIISLSVIATLSELSRRKMDKVHSELRKFTYVADEITNNPAKVREDLRHAMQVIDQNLSGKVVRPFPNNLDGETKPSPGALYPDPPIQSPLFTDSSDLEKKPFNDSEE